MDTESLRQRITTLDRLDRERVVFGAKSHDYRFQPVSAEEMNEFEEWCGCRLPEDYRSFLLTFGTGAGPAYGLWPLSTIREELGQIYQDYQEEHQLLANPADVFVLEEEILEAASRGKRREFAAPPTPGGFLPITHKGCEYVTLLVTTGRCRGWVFHADNFGSAGSVWLPESLPVGVLEVQPTELLFPAYPTFLDWITGWIDRGIETLK